MCRTQPLDADQTLDGTGRFSDFLSIPVYTKLLLARKCYILVKYEEKTRIIKNIYDALKKMTSDNDVVEEKCVVI